MPGQVLHLESYKSGLLDRALEVTFFDCDEGLYLTSDRAVPTWAEWKRTTWLREGNAALQQRVDAAYWPLFAMGEMMMFPGRQVGGPSINQAKVRPSIGDRLDLTVECIRRYYQAVNVGADPTKTSPLGAVLWRYRQFFELFADFSGYVDFWLLHDLVTTQGRVRFLMEGERDEYDFDTRSPLPQSADDYIRYLDNAEDFVAARNDRMVEVWNRKNPTYD